MKKFIAIFFAIIIAVVAVIYGYFTYNNQATKIQKENAEYEKYYNTEIYGAELATIINKAIDSNETNEVEKDNKGKYIENEENSIKINIKIIDNDTIYDMETFYTNGIERFVENFNTIKFKCTSINYHPNTGRIKDMIFEQTTQ